MLSFSAPLAQKLNWVGVYKLTVLATDLLGNARDIFASSVLIMDRPETVSLTPIVDTTGVSELNYMISAFPPSVALALATLSPPALATALAALSPLQLATLSNAIVAALPRETIAGRPATVGLPYVNSSGFVVVVQ